MLNRERPQTRRYRFVWVAALVALLVFSYESHAQTPAALASSPACAYDLRYGTPVARADAQMSPVEARSSGHRVTAAPDCGRAWRMVPSPNVGSGNNELYALAVLSANDIWAAGRYSTAAGYFTLTMHWDGSIWSVVPSPNVGTKFNQLGALAAVSPGDIWAVGSWSNDNLVNQTLIQHWDGTAWSVVTSPVAAGTSAFLYGAAALSANDVWAVGYTNIGVTAQLTLVEHWDGSAWSTVISPSPSANRDILWAVSAVSANDVWAAGNSYDGTNFRTLIEHWNGTEWSAVPSANGPSINFLWGIEAVSANDVWALGRSYDGAAYPGLIERWNGSAWNLVAYPDDQFYNELYDAAALAADDVWAVGRHGGGFSNNLALVSHWDGSAWSIVANDIPAGSEENFLYAVEALSADDVWAVGSYVKDDIKYQTLIEHYSDVKCPTGTPEAPPTATAMTSAPNPARARATLRFALQAPGSVNLALFDAVGRRVATLVDREPMGAGPHEVTLRTGTLQTGLYLARLESGSQIETHKLMVVR